MALLPPRTYSIKNARFRNVVVLPNDNRDSDIVGRPEENSAREKWDVSRLGNGRYIILNQAIDHFAGSAHGAGEGDFVYGGERAKHLIIKETKVRDIYTISPADATDLFWGLLDGETDTPIALANVATDPKNQWMFTPIIDVPPRRQVIAAYETLHVSSIAPPTLQASHSSDASQHGSIQTDSSAPRPPRPASDAHVYMRNLILKGNGCPLYIPEPSGNSAVYRTKGVRIGDVGFVTDDGYFKALFNIRASVYDPINVRGVPDGFEKIDLHGDDIEVVPNYFKSGRIVASVTTTSGVLGPDTPLVAGPSAVSNGHRLIWNTSEGAVLHLPHGATRLTCDPELFRDEAIRNGYNWYKYAWQTRRCGVRNGALCLVTGTDKTDTWMVGAFSQTPPGNQVLLNIGTDVAVHEKFPCSYSWIGTNPAMRLSECRPVTNDITVDLADMEQDDAIFRSDAPDGLTHSVFVRGFRISLRQSLWAYLSRNPLPAELSFIQDSAPEDLAGGQDRGHPPGSFSSIFFTWGRGGDSGEGPPRMSNSESNPQQAGLPNEEAMVEYIPTAAPVDPAAMVNDLLLNIVPDAQVAVIHDDEWHSLMREDDVDFPDSPELAARLNRKFMLDIRTRSVSLRPAEASLKRSPDTSSFPFSSRLSPSDQGSSRNVGDELSLDPLANPVVLRDESRRMSTLMPEPSDLPFEPTHAEDGAPYFETEHSTRLPLSRDETTRIHINPLLQYPGTRIIYDFQDHPSTIVTFPDRHPLSPEERSQPAIWPTLPYLSIKCRLLPQPIVVMPSIQGGVISIDNVVTALYDYCQKAAGFRALSASELRQVTTGYKNRITAAPDPETRARVMQHGMKMIDFLMGKSRFYGLSTSDESPDMLVLETARPMPSTLPPDGRANVNQNYSVPHPADWSPHAEPDSVVFQIPTWGI